MLQPALELRVATVLITEVTLAIGAITEAKEVVAEAEAGVMIVEIEVVSLRESTGIDEISEARLHHFVMTKFEIDGDVNPTEIGEGHHLREEVAHRIILYVILEMHRQALI
jgi:hypothetical protein